MILWGAPLLPTSAPLPAAGYPFLGANFSRMDLDADEARAVSATPIPSFAAPHPYTLTAGLRALRAVSSDMAHGREFECSFSQK